MVYRAGKKWPLSRLNPNHLSLPWAWRWWSSQRWTPPGQIVELRYFGGLSEEEIGAVMSVSTRTVERDWQFARSWLA